MQEPTKLASHIASRLSGTYEFCPRVELDIATAMDELLVVGDNRFADASKWIEDAVSDILNSVLTHQVGFTDECSDEDAEADGGADNGGDLVRRAIEILGYHSVGDEEWANDDDQVFGTTQVLEREFPNLKFVSE